MEVLRSRCEIPASAKHGVIALGNFDGVHRGHQALLARVRDLAKADRVPAGAMVFEPHAAEFFHPDNDHFRLTSIEEKLALFDATGLDFVAVASFDAAFAALTAEDFIQRVLVGQLAARHIVIGYDFFFGHKRGGSPEMLRTAGESHGFQVSIIAPVADEGEVFSSTAIRLLLAQGDVNAAAHMLGRWWQVTGKVIGGAHRGTGLGFPTANIALRKGTTLGHGIYAVRVTHGSQQLNGAAYLGTRPTFDNGHPVLEIFLFDFDGDLYGQSLQVSFIDFIRPDRKFTTPEALVAQMEADCAEARDRLSIAPAAPL
jgi:riboflavin kinase / FMN adenylyltransferase